MYINTRLGASCGCLSGTTKIIVLAAITAVFSFLDVANASAGGVTRIAPAAAVPGHPFTVIDSAERRLVPGSEAIFRYRGFEFTVLLRTHKPYATAKGRIAADMYSGTYDVTVRQPTGVEIAVGAFTIYGGREPPQDIVYDFNGTAQSSALIGSDGGSLNLDDSYGAFFNLEVPSNALPEDTEISLTGVASVANFPPGFRVLTAVRLQPGGLSFDGSVMLTITLPASSRAGFPAVAFLTNDDGTDLAFLPLTGTDPVAAALSDASVSIALGHFTVAGAAEADGSDAFPPPPEGASAEERAMAAIARRMAELLATESEIYGDPQFFEALWGWLTDPVDGLVVRAGLAVGGPDGITIGDLREFVGGEFTRLLAQANALLDDAQLDVIEAETFDAVANLFDAFRDDLRSQSCTEDTLEAQHELNRLPDMIADFADGAVEPRFEEASFFCTYDITLAPEFQAAFDNREIEIEYRIVLQDGSTYSGSLQELSNEFQIPSVRIEIENGFVGEAFAGVLRAESTSIGPSSVTVQIADSAEDEAGLLWLPSFLGSYMISGSGTAAGCIDDFDAGAGGGTFFAAASSQTVTGANETSASVQFTLVGGWLTFFLADVTFTSIDVGRMSGSIDGHLRYAYEEYDPEDKRMYPVIGGGGFSGVFMATGSSRVANVSYTGSSNWCTSYFGTAVLLRM